MGEIQLASALWRDSEEIRQLEDLDQRGGGDVVVEAAHCVHVVKKQQKAELGKAKSIFCCFFFYICFVFAMNITRDDVNQWLYKERRGRDWLAEKCGVGIAAVGHWLNKRENARDIPAEHQITISKLMQLDAAKHEMPDKTPQNLVLEFTQAEFDAICESAASERLVPRVWATDWLNALASMDNKSLAELAEQIMADSTPQQEGNRHAG